MKIYLEIYLDIKKFKDKNIVLLINKLVEVGWIKDFI